MAKVIRADILGYCMGVRRAVEIAENACSQYSKGNVFTFGPLIHNKVALENLEKKGLKILEESQINILTKFDTVIIRAHGISPKIRKLLQQSGCNIIDATCPRVLSSQKRAKDFAQKGYTIILAGDKNHGEVTGIAGCAENEGAICIVVENSQDAKSITQKIQKAILLSQTTISRSEYDNIAKVLKEHISQLQVFNTICPATSERQKSLDELAQKVDGIIVIGGKNSANTQRLFLATQKYCEDSSYKCKISCHIETPEEIPTEFFNLQTVGLTAGASTPDDIILNVEQVLQN